MSVSGLADQKEKGCENGNSTGYVTQPLSLSIPICHFLHYIQF